MGEEMFAQETKLKAIWLSLLHAIDPKIGIHHLFHKHIIIFISIPEISICIAKSNLF
jgi:hypothetical protein